MQLLYCYVMRIITTLITISLFLRLFLVFVTFQKNNYLKILLVVGLVSFVRSTSLQILILVSSVVTVDTYFRHSCLLSHSTFKSYYLSRKIKKKRQFMSCQFLGMLKLESFSFPEIVIRVSSNSSYSWL